MQHVTLTTGDTRWSPRAEVDDRLMGLLVDHLAALLHGRAPVPSLPEWTAHGTREHNVLVATLEYQGAPILSFAVVPADGDAAAIARLLGSPGAPIATPGPWCLVRLYPTIAALDRADLGWLGDYERCLAWAWLDVPRTGVQ